MVAPGYLKGDEPVVIVNASPEGRVAFSLPAYRRPNAKFNYVVENRDFTNPAGYSDYQYG